MGTADLQNDGALQYLGDNFIKNHRFTESLIGSEKDITKFDRHILDFGVDDR